VFGGGRDLLLSESMKSGHHAHLDDGALPPGSQ
jgi:hypothetical protein